jgi:plasmid maintenance system antidote protein VapI
MHRKRTDRQALRRLIAEADLTVAAFGRAAELSPTQVKYVLNGKRGLSDRAALRAARVLGVDSSRFMIEEPDPPEAPPT